MKLAGINISNESEGVRNRVWLLFILLRVCVTFEVVLDNWIY
jgi:hypothetical protein